MQDKLFAEFPGVSYATWRQQVEDSLKGSDFDKRLVTRTLDGLVVQPLYTSSPGSAHMAAAVSSWRPARGSCDVRAEQVSPNPERAAQAIASDLAAGASSLWLRFDARARTADAARGEPDGLWCERIQDLTKLLAGVDLQHTEVSLDAGGNVAVSALYLALADTEPRRGTALRGTLGCDPLGALARDGSLPFDLPTARALQCELARHTADAQPGLRAIEVSSDPYHLAGATSAQELAYALATATEYVRWCMQAGLSTAQASAQLGFRVTVASDLFVELAKLRALRLCWAKIIAAFGGDAEAQSTRVHALTSLRTKTRCDPWVNLLRTTTEAFGALVAGADSVTARAFDVAIGESDEFAQRIARNVPIILSEEAHATRVSDAAAGSYYVETLTDQLSRAAWQIFQDIERRGGMSVALTSGEVARAIDASAELRDQAVAKRLAPIIGVSEFANMSEEPVRRPPPTRGESSARSGPSRSGPPSNGHTPDALSKLKAATGPGRIALAIAAAKHGASLSQLTAALAGANAAARSAALPVRRAAEVFESLRERTERHVAQGQTAPSVFLCNLGAIPEHKPRASFATGFFSAAGIAVVDNDGFGSEAEAVAAFTAARTDVAILCGSDAQYAEWVPRMAPALRNAGARQVILAGRPGDKQQSYEQAGVSSFIFVGVDVAAALRRLLDSMGVA